MKRVFTKEHCDNISKARIGKHYPKLSEAKKGKRGSHHSEETKNKIRLSKLGKPRPPHVIEAIRRSNLGKKRTFEARKKQSETMIKNGSKRGKNNPNYGIHRYGALNPMFGKSGKLSPTYGRKHTLEERKNISIALQGKMSGKNNPMYGVPSPFTGRKHSESTLEIMRYKRQHLVIPTKDTKPELMLQIALVLHKIQFQKHKPMMGQPDIFIEPNVCIFVDGDFWHANPDKYEPDNQIFGKYTAKDIWAKDLRINHKLNLKGYQVIRIWESDIKKNANESAINIIKLIQSMRGVLI